jgi:hypothetical protein
MGVLDRSLYGVLNTIVFSLKLPNILRKLGRKKSYNVDLAPRMQLSRRFPSAFSASLPQMGKKIIRYKSMSF